MPQLEFLILKSRLQNFYRLCFKVCVSRWQQITRVLLVAASFARWGGFECFRRLLPLSQSSSKGIPLCTSLFTLTRSSQGTFAEEQKFLPLHAMQSSVGMIYSGVECHVSIPLCKQDTHTGIQIKQYSSAGS